MLSVCRFVFGCIVKLNGLININVYIYGYLEQGRYNPDATNFSKTKKVTWLADSVSYVLSAQCLVKLDVDMSLAYYYISTAMSFS